MWKTDRVAKRPASTAELREAVERTVQATMGSAERQRERTQGALDDLAGSVDQLRKGAEAGLARGRKAVAGAIESGRPATYEDIRELKAELRRIGRRLDAIEERLPAKRASRPSARARPSAPAREEARLLVVVPGRRVLITGVGGHLGGLLAARLEADPDVEAVFGLDTRRPRVTLERTELIDADVRDPGIARHLIAGARPRSWCTTGSSASPARACRRARCTTST